MKCIVFKLWKRELHLKYNSSRSQDVKISGTMLNKQKMFTHVSNMVTYCNHVALNVTAVFSPLVDIKS